MPMRALLCMNIHHDVGVSADFFDWTSGDACTDVGITARRTVRAVGGPLMDSVFMMELPPTVLGAVTSFRHMCQSQCALGAQRTAFDWLMGLSIRPPTDSY